MYNPKNRDGGGGGGGLGLMYNPKNRVGGGEGRGENPTQVYFVNVLPLCNARCNLIDEKEPFPWQHQ